MFKQLKYVAQLAVLCSLFAYGNLVYAEPRTMAGVITEAMQATINDDAQKKASAEQWQWQQMPAHWWKRFPQDSTESIAAKFKQFQQHLAEEAEQLEGASQQDKAKQLLERIHVNQQSYLSLRNSKIPDAKAAEYKAELGSLEGWQEALQQRRLRLQALQEQRIEIEQLNAQIEAIEEEADEKNNAYLRIVVAGSGKFISFLQMFERRLAWLSVTQSLQLQQQQLVQLTEEYQKIQERWHVSIKQLALEATDEEQVQKKIDALVQQIEQQQQKLQQLQAKNLIVVTNDEMTKSKVSIGQGELLAGQSGLLLATSQLQWEQRLLSFVQAQLHEGFDWDQVMRQPLKFWEKEVQEIEKERLKLRSKVDTRRDQIQSSLLSLPDTFGLTAKEQQRIRSQYQEALKHLGEAQRLLKNTKGQLQDIQTLHEQQLQLLLAQDGIWSNRWLALSQFMSELSSQAGHILGKTIFTLGDSQVSLLSLLYMVIVLISAWWGSYLLRKGLNGFSDNNQSKLSQHSAHLLGRLMHYTIMFVGVMIALSMIGIDFTSLAWIAGALSVGIGFGLRDIVKNFASGLIIMFDRSIRIGDTIEIAPNVRAKVRDIGLHSSLVKTKDNLEIVMPNSEFVTGRVQNWTMNDNFRRVRVPFSVVLNTDKRLVVEAALAAAMKVPYTVQIPGKLPRVELVGMEGKLSFELMVWVRVGAVKFRYSTRPAYFWQLDTALRERGIQIYEPPA